MHVLFAAHNNITGEIWQTLYSREWPEHAVSVIDMGRVQSKTHALPEFGDLKFDALFWEVPVHHGTYWAPVMALLKPDAPVIVQRLGLADSREAAWTAALRPAAVITHPTLPPDFIAAFKRAFA